MADYANPDVLVDTDWVAEHGQDENVRLLEVDVDTTAYDQGHIEGAVGINWKSQLQDGVRRDLTSKADFEKLMSESGVCNDTTVVVYGDNNNWFATWAYWQLKYYGHKDARVMDGGRAKWLAEGRPTTTDAPSPVAASYTTQEPDCSIRALRDYITSNLSNLELVDVRSPAEYSGELLAPEHLPQEGAQRGGHIPGAANVPWATAVAEDGTFKSADELNEIYGGKGISGDKEIVAYCRIGERSSHTWFVLSELLGYPNVRNYDGSWTEWGSAVGVPVER